MLVDLDDEIRRMNNDEYINKHKVRLAQSHFEICVHFWEYLNSQLCNNLLLTQTQHINHAI